MPHKFIYSYKEGKNYSHLLLTDGSYVPSTLKCNRYSRQNVIAKCGKTVYVNIFWEQTKSENNSGGATPLHDW